MRLIVKSLKTIRLQRSKQVLAICIIVFIFIISGAIYGYSLLRHDPQSASQATNINQAKELLAEGQDSPSTPPVDEQTSIKEETEPEPTSNTSPTQPDITDSTRPVAPEVYRPATLSVTEVRASGGEVCDGTVYKLGLHNALIFSNGRPGTILWRIEGLRNGSIETVATGSLQLAENRHSHELPLYGMHYMTQPIGTDTGIRFHVTSPNSVTSQWIFPSEALPGESPCTH